MIRVHTLIVTCLLAMNSIAAAQGPVEAVPQATAATREQREAAEEVIREYFPDLDKDVLAGWVDVYADLSSQELAQLMQQKSMLPLTEGASTFLSGYTAELQLPGGVKSQQDFFSVAKTILRNNILHAETPGYRRRMVKTMVAVPSAGADPTVIELAKPVFDFTPAGRFVTQNPLHVSLADKRGFGTMFRLEPGCVLTRCGRFERLEDGRLGLKVGQQSLVLYGDIKIPAHVSNAYIDTSGLVSSVTSPSSGEKTSRVKYGQIQVAAIYNVSLLQSTNGVFFKVPVEEIDRAVKMISKVSLVSRSLEQSNVDVAKEMDRLERIKFLDR